MLDIPTILSILSSVFIYIKLFEYPDPISVCFDGNLIIHFSSFLLKLTGSYLREY